VTLEREADEFGSHLLMPGLLFNPAIKAYKWPNIAQIQEVAESFQTSQAATLIRLAKVDTFPVCVACYSLHKRHWYCPAPHVPRRWYLKPNLDPDTFAYGLLTRGEEVVTPRKQSADAWFGNDDADEFEVLEQCVRGTEGKVLVVLYLSDREMFDRGFDSNSQWHRR
jgi:hypothetical protein